MKRCPQCQFIYPDSDDVCDFDQTRLVDAAESEIAAITNTPEQPARANLDTQPTSFDSRKRRRAVAMVASVVLFLGLVIFGVYFAVHRQMTPQTISQQTDSNLAKPEVVEGPAPTKSPAVAESPSPEPTIDTVAKSASVNSQATTAHLRMSTGPVSTGTQGTESKTRNKRVILLTTGGRVEADEVWRTKDGVWYRRAGIVTLLKKNRVKAIVSQ